MRPCQRQCRNVSRKEYLEVIDRVNNNLTYYSTSELKGDRNRGDMRPGDSLPSSKAARGSPLFHLLGSGRSTLSLMRSRSALSAGVKSRSLGARGNPKAEINAVLGSPICWVIGVADTKRTGISEALDKTRKIIAPGRERLKLLAMAELLESQARPVRLSTYWTASLLMVLGLETEPPTLLWP